jgi:excisionase family DNA binding protein
MPTMLWAMTSSGRPRADAQHSHPLYQLTAQVEELTVLVSAIVEHLGRVARPMPPLLTCAQVGEVLGVSESWVRMEARAGRITHRRIGAQYRFTREDVDELIEHARRVGDDPRVRAVVLLEEAGRVR